jgi:hypothetical protein
MRRAIRIVFNAFYLSWDAVFGALEVDNSVVLLVTTTDVTGGNAAKVISPPRLGLLLEKRRMRTTLVQLGIGHLNLVTTTC